MKTKCTTLCYIEKDGAYLMMHRTKKLHDINAGKWIGVGGHIEEDETPEECVRRETREETGLTLTALAFRGVIHFICPDETEEMFVYTSDKFSGELKECDEGELSWVSKEKVEELDLWEGDRIFLPLLRKDNAFFSFALSYDADGKLLSNPLVREPIVPGKKPADRKEMVILQEKGAVAHYSEQLKAFGKRALIVTGVHSAKESGALADIEAALDANGIHHVVFSEVEQNPSTDTIMRAREMGVMSQADFVIGIGGGSPLDAAKAVALMIYHHDQEKEYLYESRHDEHALPVVAVPTTCGTGSEATGVAVLTRKERRTKSSIPYKIYPGLALVDGSYLKTASLEIIGNTAIDALSHLLESYFNSNATELSCAYVLQGLSIWRRVKDAILGRREMTEKDREDLMTASTLAGMAIAITGTCLPHALSYTLTMIGDIPHGKAVGFFLSRFLGEAGDEGLMLARAAGFFDLEELEGYYHAVCKPGSIEREIRLQAVEAVAVNPGKLSRAPFPADRALLMRIAGLDR